MRGRKSVKLAPTALAELVDAAEAEGLSVSRLVAEALREAVRHSLDDDVEPLSAGDRVLSVSLEEGLIRKAEARAVELGLSFGAYLRHALGGYLFTEEEEEEDEDDFWSLLLDRERRQEAVAETIAGGVRRLVSSRPSRPELSARRSGSGLSMCSTCRRIVQAQPDALGNVACPYCGTYAPPLDAPPNAEARLREEEADRQRRARIREREQLELRIRAQLRRERAGGR
jgi:hypothetical protein